MSNMPVRVLGYRGFSWEIQRLVCLFFLFRTSLIAHGRYILQNRNCLVSCYVVMNLFRAFTVHRGYSVEHEQLTKRHLRCFLLLK